MARFWHITDDASFEVDASFKPRGPNGKSLKQVALFLTADPHEWFPNEQWMGQRQWVAEVEIPDEEYNVSWAEKAVVGLTEIVAWGESLRRATVLRVVPRGYFFE